MNRREFLTSLAKLSVVGLMTTFRPTHFEAKAAAKIFKGSATGQIFESVDGGQSWQVIANFGQDYLVSDIIQDEDQLYARVSYQGYSFFVKSLDGRTWWTASSPFLISLYLPVLVHD